MGIFIIIFTITILIVGILFTSLGAINLFFSKTYDGSVIDKYKSDMIFGIILIIIAVIIIIVLISNGNFYKISKIL